MLGEVNLSLEKTYESILVQFNNEIDQISSYIAEILTDQKKEVY